jgi:hypothetical protein
VRAAGAKVFKDILRSVKLVYRLYRP